MKCPVCENYSYKDICPTCGYDLENNNEYHKHLYYLSYSEICKHDEQIKIMKKNYEDLHNKPEEQKETVYELAKKAHKERNYNKAIAYYELAIQEEIVDAYIDLAKLYRNEGIKTGSLMERVKYYKKSRKLLEEAVEYESTEAMMRLAESYLLYYFGSLPSRKKALNLYQRAIDLGDMEASVDLAKKYRKGYGILRPNYKKADELDDEEI